MFAPSLDQVRAVITRKENLPQWIQDTASVLHGTKSKLFLETNCDTTAYAVCRTLHPTPDEWRAVDKPSGPVYRVVFDECDHTFVVVYNKVYQSYWNRHKCQISDFDPSIPLWSHVSVNNEAYKDCDVTFFEP